MTTKDPHGNDKPTTASPSINRDQNDLERHESGGKEVEAGHASYHGIDTRNVQPGADAVYDAKIAILNEALIDLGMGQYQWMVFLTTGLGWFIDNFWMQAITIISPPIQKEFAVNQIAFLTVAKYAGLVIGASVWPMTADFIGRRLAFNATLLITALGGLVGAGSPNFFAISLFCAVIGLGSGGNQPVDSAIFLEFTPATHQYLLTMQSGFWSLGQAVAALVAWPLIVNFTCSAGTECTFQNNLGWRYTYWAFGGLTLAMFFARLFFRIHETPKYLLGKGKDREATEVIQDIAERNRKTTWLIVDHFDAISDRLQSPDSQETPESSPISSNILRRAVKNWAPHQLTALFSTPRMALSTSMMLFLWCAIGMAYPLYNSFIPIYLEAKGVSSGGGSLNETYRNYAIQAVCGIPASIIGGFTVEMKRVGRKGTGAIACICTGVFLFLFTRANTPASVLGFSCVIAFFQNLVYGLLYSYTPELFPAPIRGTGNGLVALVNRFSGLMAPIIAAYVGVETSMPIWISAALFIVAGLVFLGLPYEMRGRAAA